LRLTLSDTILDVFDRRVERQPDAIIYRFVEALGHESSISYRQLGQRVGAMADCLSQHGSAGDRALIAMQPGLGFIVALFGCFAAGWIAVPTPPPRARTPSALLGAVCDDCRPAVLLVDGATERVLAAHATQDQRISPILRLRVPEGPAEGEVHALAGNLRPRDVAILQYTSGSTGRPKGVVITHKNIINNLHAQHQLYQSGPFSRGVIWLPPYHDMGLGSGILQPMYANSTMTLMAPLVAMQRPLRWLETIHRTQATVSGGPPFAYAACVASVSAEDRARLDLSSWACAFIGAEPVAASVIDSFAAAFEPCGFRREAFQPSYGLAEATLLVTGVSKTTGPKVHPAFSRAGERTVSCGACIDDHELLVVEPQTRIPCRDSEEGEIWIAGPSVARGYWNNAEATAATFGAYLADGRGPYLRTGDLGVLSDGELGISGRIKNILIFAGRKVHAEDIEASVRTRCDANLRDMGIAALAIRQDGDERLVMIMEVPRKGRAKIDLVELGQQIRAVVACDHEVSVADLVFVMPSELPRTSSGKIQHHLCRDLYAKLKMRENLHA
jgi:acyl-CoA synthetase (AMP-forming)/AMP-acid ligase II